MIRVTSFGEVKNDWRDDLIVRTKRLTPFEWKQIPIRRMPDQRGAQLLAEEKAFLETTKSFTILDAGGKLMSSEEFFQWLFRGSQRHLVVGPAIGFHSEFKSRAELTISLSPLTFTHALAQTMLAETIYRAACQAKNHPFVK